MTFLQVDPFFVYDLSNPAAPLALGELKIPGFSSYLHPVGENHVLGIGYDGGGWPRKVKASLFDVTNPLQPVEQSVLLLGDSYTDSDALWDPHAFTFYYPETDSPDAVMAVPVRSYASSQYGTGNESGIRLVNVRPGQGGDALRLQGTLDMSDLLGVRDPGQSWRSADARRAVFVGDDVYAVSDSAIRSATIAQPASPLGTVSIP